MFLREKIQEMSNAGIPAKTRDAFTSAFHEGVRRGMTNANAMTYAENNYAELSNDKRKSLTNSDFAIPDERKFPIKVNGKPSKSHAVDALARASGTKYEGRVKAAVKKLFPDLPSFQK